MFPSASGGHHKEDSIESNGVALAIAVFGLDGQATVEQFPTGSVQVFEQLIQVAFCVPLGNGAIQYVAPITSCLD